MIIASRCVMTRTDAMPILVVMGLTARHGSHLSFVSACTGGMMAELPLAFNLMIHLVTTAF
jgi:hypothetical protein